MVLFTLAYIINPAAWKPKIVYTGYQLLIDFAKKHNIPFELCGKIIVASDESELEALHKIYDRGIENGLKDLKWLEEGEMKEIEPHLRGIKGVRVPQTGIIDYKAMSQKLKGIADWKWCGLRFWQ